MQVLVKTDNVIRGSENLNSSVEATVVEALRKFGEQVITVHVHLKDVNSHKKGEGDKHCTMEARLAGIQPIVVHQDADTVDAAVDGCAEKLWKTIDRHIGKMGDHKGNMPSGGEPGV